MYGTEVTLTAQPGEDRAFSQWAILDPCHPGDLNYATTDSNNPLMLTMDENWEVQAVFKCGSQAAMGMPAMVLVLAVFGFASRRWRSRRRA